MRHHHYRQPVEQGAGFDLGLPEATRLHDVLGGLNEIFQPSDHQTRAGAVVSTATEGVGGRVTGRKLSRQTRMSAWKGRHPHREFPRRVARGSGRGGRSKKEWKEELHPLRRGSWESDGGEDVHDALLDEEVANRAV